MHVGEQLLKLDNGCVLLAALPVVTVDLLLLLQVCLEELGFLDSLFFRHLLQLLAFISLAHRFLDLLFRLNGQASHLRLEAL